jgi:predicted nucleic acid-binding Zn ribbon protein
MQTLNTDILQTKIKEKVYQKPCPKLKRQTHMHCTVCQDIAEYYDQVCCHKCGSSYKWSVPWKNEPRNTIIQYT